MHKWDCVGAKLSGSWILIGLDCAGLGWVGLDWVGLDCVNSKKYKTLPCDRTHFSTDCFNRQILGRFVAPYWAVFVFDLRKFHK